MHVLCGLCRRATRGDVSELRRQFHAAPDPSVEVAGQIPALGKTRGPVTGAPVSSWSIYLLRCSDNSLYTGIATDVERRLSEHSGGARGAKYLKGRGPFTLVFEQAVGDRGCATRIEHYIKQLPKTEKEDLVRKPDDFRARVRLLADSMRGDASRS